VHDASTQLISVRPLADALHISLHELAVELPKAQRRSAVGTARVGPAHSRVEEPVVDTFSHPAVQQARAEQEDAAVADAKERATLKGGSIPQEVVGVGTAFEHRHEFVPARAAGEDEALDLSGVEISGQQTSVTIPMKRLMVGTSSDRALENAPMA
jgi:hypothetical protein